MTPLEEKRDTYEIPRHGWTCFHCGENFRTVGAARDHFGIDQSAEPGCVIRVKYGDERGLLMELRKAQDELARYRNEDSDTDHRMRAMSSYHQIALRRAEESGYAKGLKDGRELCI